jgi:GNAT superfamily N-acetyltransferase
MKTPRSSLGQRMFKTEIVIRTASVADAAAISALLSESFAEFKAMYTPAGFAATVLPESGIRARLQEGPIWVAEATSSLIGTVGVKIRPEAIMVRGMAVNPSARGLGIGMRLLGQAERFARDSGSRLLELYTTAFLIQAIQLYQKAGFAFTGERTDLHGIELLRMTKALVA